VIDFYQKIPFLSNRAVPSPWVQGATPFFLNEFAPAPSIEGNSKRRWNCLDNSPFVKGDVTLFSRGKLRNCNVFQRCSKNLPLLLDGKFLELPNN
jgi:hypothetical protein